ncbi:hypothetical protein [Microbacterium sp.]|uniref:hypothetical protein n=1 Tax=Microbacterium sp. TaxID=51671 RepID=UPI0039E26E4F
MPKGYPNPKPAPLEVSVTPLTAGGAIKHLISALGAEFDAVAKVDIALRHPDGDAVVRLLGADRSLRSVRVELPTERGR